MKSGKIKNITPKQFREFLDYQGLKHIRTKGGHEVWSRQDLTRPVIIQNHLNPIPEFVVKNNLHTIGSTKQELLDFIGR